MIQNPTSLSREVLVGNLASRAVTVARGSAADAQERYTDEVQTAEARLEDCVRGEIDDLFDHPDIDGDEFDFEDLQAEVIKAASEVLN